MRYALLFIFKWGTQVVLKCLTRTLKNFYLLSYFRWIDQRIRKYIEEINFQRGKHYRKPHSSFFSQSIRRPSSLKCMSECIWTSCELHDSVTLQQHWPNIPQTIRGVFVPGNFISTILYFFKLTKQFKPKQKTASVSLKRLGKCQLDRPTKGSLSSI